jgi:molecular chaperone DnaK
LIDRNTTIPVKKSQIFSTAADSQPSVEIHVLQGERPMARDNVSLGKFLLDGIPPAPRGVPQIEVSFDLDANGILHVTAKDLGTNKEQSIRISSPSKLSKDEVDKFVKQAEQFADEDKKRRDEVDAKNELDGLVYATEKSVKDHGDKISGDERLALDRALSEAKEALKGTNVDAMKKAKETLTGASHKLAEAIYKEAASKAKTDGGAEKASTGGGGPSAGTDGGKPGSEAVDAEVVDEEKK